MRKRDGKNRLASPSTFATPTKERSHQNGGLKCETMPSGPNQPQIKRYRAVWESPLDAYRDLGVIDDPAYKAGQIFHRAYYGAVISRKMDMRPTSPGEAAMGKSKDERLLDQAYNFLPPDAVNAVVDVCGFSIPAYNPRAREALRKGLGHLAIQWHISAIEVCEPKKA